jgi:hypothetical protein
VKGALAALVLCSMVAMGCKMRGPRYADAASAVDATTRVSLAECIVPGSQPTRILAFATFTPDGHMGDVAIGRSTDERTATCVKKALSQVSVEPTGVGVLVAVAFTLPRAPGSSDERSAPFDRDAAVATLVAAQAALSCGPENHGQGHAETTFASSGEAIAVTLDDSTTPPPSTVRCIEATFLRARVPPFGGGSVKVGKTFQY